MLRHPTDEHGRLVNPAPYQKISYWLLPESVQLHALQSLVDKLAERYGGPSFEPHVTVYFGPLDHQESPADLIRRVFSGVPSLVLRSRSLEFSAKFTKSFYLQFDASESVQKLCESLRSGSSISGDYSLDPHMSLFYGRLDSDSRTELRSLVEIPDEIRFDTVWAVSTPDSVTRKDNVRDWRLVYSMKLVS